MSFVETAETAFQYWAQLDCPTSLKLFLLGKAGQWAEVLTSEVVPEHFISAWELAKASAAVAFLKKNPDVPGFSDGDRKARALELWHAGEASCFNANERLSPVLVSPLSGDTPAEFLRRVRRRLLSWLGLAPDDDELKARARHGPGTTFASSVANPNAADKYSDKMTVTSNAVVHLLNLAGTKWMSLTASRLKVVDERSFVRDASWTPLPKYDEDDSFTGTKIPVWESLDDAIEVTRGNRHAVVPKTAVTDRNIAVEPTVNLYFQLAVGNAMRARMRKRAGWDLDHVQPIHREMARRGSIDGSFATIDLSNASDTLCKNLVRILLRDSPWLDVLEDLRSTRTRVEGNWHLLEKFSSMGNGYTFELETCVFAAIAAECLSLKGHEPVLGYNLFVFGDDIIVPGDSFGFVVAALQWCGFQVNSKKTYGTGHFRESCGGDFFKGHPVRGFYLKAALSNAVPDRIYTTHNGVKQVLDNCGLGLDFLGWIRARFLPDRLKDVGGSERLGDTVLHGLPAKVSWRRGIRWVRAVRWSKPVLVRWSYYSEEARLACRLTGYGDTFGINTRGKRACAEIGWVSDS